MSGLPVKYCGSLNFGDALNPFIFERILGVPVRHASIRHARVLGLGSVAESAMRPKRKSWRYWPALHLRAPLAVWTSGFIRDEIPADFIFIRRLRVLALRGRRSLELMRRFQSVPDNCPLGDGALLAAPLLSRLPAKRWRVGLIPHVVHGADHRLRGLTERFSHVAVISLNRNPLEILAEIASCDAVFSSSLHGLIVSDVFGIPNAPLDAGPGLIGGWFKFHDYDSAFTGPAAMSRTVTLDRLAEAFETETASLMNHYVSRQPQIDRIRESLITAFREGVEL